MLTALLTAAVQKAQPHVTRWLEQAVPVVTSTWNRFIFRGTAGPATRAQHVPAAEAASPTETQEVVDALEAYRASMSTDEAQNRFLAALVTRLYNDEQLRVLREARIEDVNDLLVLDSTVEAPTADRLRAAIMALVEENPSLLGDGAPAELGRILGGRRTEAAGVPLPGGRATARPRRTERGQ
ncbi:hypothetical protein RMN56_20775 [Micromonospora halotolerans]|uniref:Uncharacterized protein n=1 Tax=Micromonospora halotolerans TaxID=709879 RepID=A0ABY9ZSM9_9ACTN|nr:hypothetical protein [Micromonospora halotolerans]WNM37590.1 hypothetical protein RMN56_20775 [Micromonospora halotolerans]